MAKVRKTKNPFHKVPKNNFKNMYNKTTLYIIISIVLCIRILFTVIPPSYKIDIAGYVYWSNLLSEKSLSSFYGPNTHCIYGPGYLYLLLISGKISHALSLGNAGQEFMIKIWSVLSDMIGGYFIYLISKRYQKQKLGFFLALFYVLNPAIIINSSVWGQFDSFTATLLIISIYNFNIRKPVLGIMFFTIAVLTKPQSAMLVFIVAILFIFDFSFKKFSYASLSTVFIYTIMILPFFNRINGTKNNIILDFFMFVPKIVLTGGTDYPYATANGFNLWTLLGGQAVMDSEPFLGLTYYIWSNIFVVVTLGYSIVLILKNKGDIFSVYFCSFFTCFCVFTVWSKMHERYLLPAIIFATICIIWDLKMLIPTIIISTCSFLNQYYLYDMSFKDQYWVPNNDEVAYFVAFVTVAGLLYCIYHQWILLNNKKASTNYLYFGGK